MPLETQDLRDIEIFAEGTWNGDTYTAGDLDAMIEAFCALGDRLKPYAKLGHDPGQKLLQRDGYPAAGWITRLYRSGQKLLADITQVPARLAELIRAGAYKRVSSEIYWDYADGEKTWPRVLKAVAFLGADAPAVTSLADIAALYTGEGVRVAIYTQEGGPMMPTKYHTDAQPPTEEELKQREAALWAREQAVSERERALTDRENALAQREAAQAVKEAASEDIKEELDEVKAELTAMRHAQRQAEIKAFIEARKAEGRILPAHAPLVAALMGAAPVDTVVTYSADGGKTTTQTSLSRLFEQFVGSLPKLVELKELSASTGQEPGAVPEPTDEHAFRDAVAHRAREYRTKDPTLGVKASIVRAEVDLRKEAGA